MAVLNRIRDDSLSLEHKMLMRCLEAFLLVFFLSDRITTRFSGRPGSGLGRSATAAVFGLAEQRSAVFLAIHIGPRDSLAAEKSHHCSHHLR